MKKTVLLFYAFLFLFFITTLKLNANTIEDVNNIDTARIIKSFSDNNANYIIYNTKNNEEEKINTNIYILYFFIFLLFLIIIAAYVTFLIHKNKERNKKLFFEEELKIALNIKDKKYTDIVRMLPQIIFETNRDGYFTFVNEQCIIKTGYKQNKIYLSALNDLIYYANTYKPINHIAENTIEELNQKEFLLKKSDGAFLNIILYISPSYIEGNYFGSKGIIFDITERKTAEENLIKTILATEEKERIRFSKDLHDTLGPLLSTLKLYINELEEPKYSKEENKNLLQEINNMINDAVAYAREISHNLAPSTLKESGLYESLNLFIEKINTLNKIEIILKYKNKAKRYSLFFEINVYRIILELIQNSLKHAEAKNIAIDISDDNILFELKYFDNGKGISFKKNKKNNEGIGLINIKNRVKSLNGQYKIQTSENEGFSFIMSAPVDKPEN